MDPDDDFDPNDPENSIDVDWTYESRRDERWDD